MDPVVLAIDAGSTSAKAQLFVNDGRPLLSPVRASMPIAADGTADPEALGAAVDSVVDAALAEAGERARFPPVAVALSCAWHGLVGVAADGSPTTSLSTWAQADPEVGRAAAELVRRLPDPDAVARRTGAPIHPSLPAARLLSLIATHPEAAGATVRWCSTAEWLESRWFATAPGPSASMASATGCYDQEARSWDSEVLDAVGVRPDSFRPVDDAPRHGLAATYQNRWAPLAGSPWMAGLGDGACAIVGTGCGGERAALTVGTSAAVRVLAPPAARDGRPRALFAYLLDPERVVIGAARSNAGNLVEWAKRVLNLEADDLVAAATARPPGGSGLRADPALAGERSPHWPLAASGSLSGLRPTTTALDVLQALLEEAALGLADCFRELEAHLGPLTVVASGGAVTGSRAWSRLLADALGRPVIRSAVEEPSARGAALLAVERLGGPAVAPSADFDSDTVEADRNRTAHLARMPRTTRRPG